MTKRLFTLAFLAFACLISFAGNSNKDIDYLRAMIDKEGVAKTKSYLLSKQEEISVGLDILGGLEVVTLPVKTKGYNKKDEKYISLELPSSVAVTKKNYKEFLSDLYFQQEYSYPNSHYALRLDKANLKTIEKPNLEILTVYYSDGSTGDYLGDRTRPVDSLRVKVSYELIEKYSKYEFNNIEEIEGGVLLTDSIANNFARVILSGKAKNLYKLYALNIDGKALKQISELKGDAYRGKPVDGKDVVRFSEALANITKLMGRATTADALKTLIARELKGQMSILEEDGDQYYEAYYEGNIFSLVAIIADKRTTETKELTIHNAKASALKYTYAYDEVNRKYGFVNQDGDMAIAPTYSHLEQLNNRYYSQETKTKGKIYYFLSETETMLIKQDVDSMKLLMPMSEETKVSIELNNKGVIAYKDGKVTIMNKWCKPVNNTWYDELKQADKNHKEIDVRIGAQWGKISYDGKVITPIVIETVKEVKKVDEPKVGESKAATTKKTEPKVIPKAAEKKDISKIEKSAKVTKQQDSSIAVAWEGGGARAAVSVPASTPKPKATEVKKAEAKPKEAPKKQPVEPVKTAPKKTEVAPIKDVTQKKTPKVETATSVKPKAKEAPKSAPVATKKNEPKATVKKIEPKVVEQSKIESPEKEEKVVAPNDTPVVAPVVPAKKLDTSKYDSVGEYNDGMAMVSKNGLFGFIDEKHEVVIPIIYAKAYPLKNGTTMVIEDNWRILGKVIDKKGKTIVPFGENPYMDESNGKRTYSVSDILYDANGKEMAE